jgi:4-amino-4-deoxy-L-arabinose transferase-like glycosyltransferase
MKKLHWLFLLVIFLIAIALRFSLITKVPLSLNWDETTFAYNAYSILQTGKDEYGVSFPLQFKSVGDYKCPLFIYALVPVIKVFGLNEFSVRFLPSALGSLSIILIFFLVSELFKNPRLALISAFFLAISPWHLQFTRAGADVGVSSFLVLLGVVCFIWGIKGKGLGFALAFTSFVAAMYTYYSERIFIPIFVPFLLIFFRKEILKQKKNFLIGGIIGFLLFLPLVFPFISSGHQEKIFKTTIFGYKRPQQYLDFLKLDDPSALVFSVFHGQLPEYSWMIFDRYLNHFSPSFLFLRGPVEDPRQYIFGMGMLYLLDLPLLILGFCSFLKAKGKAKYLILAWLLLAPIPAAITRDPVHARRAFNMVPPIMIISSFGLELLVTKISKLKNCLKALSSAGLLAIFGYFFSFYLLSYYVFTPLLTYKGPGGWQYGYRQLVEFISPIKDKYQKVIIDTSYQGPYIFFLFYEKYPPALYQPQARLIQESADVLGEGAGYNNYEFRPIYWPADRGLPKTLFAGPPERLPEGDISEKQSRILKKIYFPDGKVAFLVVETF